MNRKEFLKSLAIICIGAPSLMVLNQSCSQTKYYANAVFQEDKIIINKSEFSYILDNKTQTRNQIFINSNKLKFPICIIDKSNGNYEALLMKCTHKGCELNPAGDFFVCPCHGSEFDNSGIVLSPPANKNLFKFKIENDEENLYIYY